MAQIAVGGIDLRYSLEGPEGAPVVAFSNSLGATLEMWDALLPALSGRYRTLRYDTRGHGGSGFRDVRTEIADLAGDLAGLLDALGIARAHCVGLSLGGMTVQALACANPERVASATLMATAASLPSEETWGERARTVRTQGTAALVEATLGRWWPATRPDMPPAVVRSAGWICGPLFPASPPRPWSLPGGTTHRPHRPRPRRSAPASPRPNSWCYRRRPTSWRWRGRTRRAPI